MALPIGSRSLFLLSIGLGAAFAVACGGDDSGDDDGMDGPNDGADDEQPADDGSAGDDAPADDGPADDGAVSECSSNGDCDVVVCECPDGPVNFTGCNVLNDIGVCATAQTCASPEFGACDE